MVINIITFIIVTLIDIRGVFHYLHMILMLLLFYYYKHDTDTLVRAYLTLDKSSQITQSEVQENPCEVFFMHWALGRN